MLNKMMMIGRLTRDPETKPVGETSVTKFTVALGEKWKNKAGETVENTEFVNCESWGKTGTLIQEYLTKGSLAYFEGKYKTTTSEKDGVKKYFTNIVVDTVKFLGKSSTETKAAGGYVETAATDGSQIPF